MHADLHVRKGSFYPQTHFSKEGDSLSRYHVKIKIKRLYCSMAITVAHDPVCKMWGMVLPEDPSRKKSCKLKRVRPRWEPGTAVGRMGVGAGRERGKGDRDGGRRETRKPGRLDVRKGTGRRGQRRKRKPAMIKTVNQN